MKSNNERRGLRTWAAGLWIAAACLGSAQAQQGGIYVGTTADGHAVQFDVALDVDTGQYVVTRVIGNFTFNCPRSGTSEEWGVSIYDLYPIVDGHADPLLRDRTFYLQASLDFKSDDKIVGKIRGGQPEFADELSPPKAGQACNSDNLKFTARFLPAQTGRAEPTAAHQVTVRTDRNGRRVIEQSSLR